MHFTRLSDFPMEKLLEKNFNRWLVKKKNCICNVKVLENFKKLMGFLKKIENFVSFVFIAKIFRASKKKWKFVDD